MIEGLRAEFPGAARFLGGIRRPAVARESLLWAFVSAVGAAFITTALVQLVVGAWLFSVLFPPTTEQPVWLTTHAIATLLSMLVAGAVAFAAGRAPAVLLYLGYQLLVFIEQIPGRLTFCERSRGNQILGHGGMFSADPCDQLAVLFAGWPELVALIAGALLASWLFAKSEHRANGMLRGAGTFTLVSAVLSMILAFPVWTTPSDLAATSAVIVGAYVIAALAAGVVLASTSFARAFLVALLVAAPSLVVNLPLVRSQIAMPEATAVVVSQLTVLLVPPLAAVLLLAARAYVRVRRAGAATARDLR